jgi:Domain of unknown function (DUF4404)
MAEKEVSEALFKLREQVEKLELDHPEVKNRLEALLEKVESRFESSADGKHLQVVDEVKEAVEQFEVEHPTVTAVVAEFLQVLSNIGV